MLGFILLKEKKLKEKFIGRLNKIIDCLSCVYVSFSADCYLVLILSPNSFACLLSAVINMRDLRCKLCFYINVMPFSFSPKRASFHGADYSGRKYR